MSQTYGHRGGSNGDSYQDGGWRPSSSWASENGWDSPNFDHSNSPASSSLASPNSDLRSQFGNDFFSNNEESTNGSYIQLPKDVIEGIDRVIFGPSSPQQQPGSDFNAKPDDQKLIVGKKETKVPVVRNKKACGDTKASSGVLGKFKFTDASSQKYKHQGRITVKKQEKGTVDWDGIVEQVFQNEYEAKHENKNDVKDDKAVKNESDDKK